MRTPTEVGDGVLVLRYPQWDVNVGVVLGGTHVLVVDTRSGVAQGREVVEAVARLAPGRRVTRVVNTHVHYDHTFGNGAFADATVVAHETVLAALPAHVEATRERYRRLPDGIPAWGVRPEDVADLLATEVPPPGTGFAERTVLDLGDRRVELVHAGRAHTDGDLRVAVPDAGVTFLGDLVEESANPAIGDDAFPLEWPDTLTAHLASLPAGAVVVPGHGAPVDAGFVTRQRDELAAVAEVVRERHSAGAMLDDARREPDPRLPYPLGELHDAFGRGWAALDAGLSGGRPGGGGPRGRRASR